VTYDEMQRKTMWIQFKGETCGPRRRSNQNAVVP
jgi:hypothetical protein